jgi:hypothetical protein
MILVVDRHGRIPRCTPSAAKILNGRARIGMSFVEALPTGTGTRAAFRGGGFDRGRASAGST